MFCPECNEECVEGLDYFECLDCGECYDLDSDPDDPEIYELEE